MALRLIQALKLREEVVIDETKHNLKKETKMPIGDDEFEVMWDSDEFRACETLAQQETPVEVAVSNLIDFYGMANDEARFYYIRALQENKNREGKAIGSKGPREIEEEGIDQEPSLDKMLDLNDPKVLSGLGRLATEARLRQEAASQSAPASNKKPTSS
jgi:hypothetical protein